MHDLQTGGARIVSALSGTDLASAGFYASEPPSVTGPLTEQGRVFPELADLRIQDNAASAVAYCADRARGTMHGVAASAG